jgi:cob(I)alamin adenosyltransferase
MNNRQNNLRHWFEMSFRVFPNKQQLVVEAGPSQDIEDAHFKSCTESNLFYTDPTTSLSVLTESAHLKRGKCCGNMCRHCPYGWETVRSLSSLSLIEVHAKCVSERGAIGRQVGEFINSGDKAECQSELDVWKSRQRQDIDGLNSTVPFTKSGDKGTSTLASGERLSKTSECFMVIGSVDELCSFVGLAHSTMVTGKNEHILEIETMVFEIIQRLFDIGCVIGSGDLGPVMTFSSSNTDELETYITKQTTTFLPPLVNFILPTGSVLSSQLHVCRSVCRRVERDYVRYIESRNSNTFEPDSISVYLNRLSDFFFTASRVVNISGKGDAKFVATGEGGLKRCVQYED